MGGLVNVVKNEPVLIIGLVQVILGMLLAFGFDLTNTQVGSIMAVTAALLALLARALVTPANPPGKPVEPPPAEA